MADTLIAPAPLRTPLVDDKTPGLPTRAWSAWWQRVAEVVGDLAERLALLEPYILEVVPGVVTAEKAMVPDANADITSGLRDLAVDGAVRWDELLLTKDATDVLALQGNTDQTVTLRIYQNASQYSSFGVDTDILGTLTVGGGLELGVSPATAGDLRLASAATIAARNVADDGNIDLVETFEMTGSLNAIKYGDGAAIWIGKTAGTAPPSADLSNGYFWVEYTGSSAALKVRVAGVTQVIASVSF